MIEHVFKETQRFNQPILWVIVFGCHIPLHVWGIQELIREYAQGQDFLKSETVQAVIAAMLLFNLLVLLLAKLKLETRIDAIAVAYRYPPVSNQWQKILRDEIKSVEVKKYSPWVYGGWGIKYSWKGWAYNVRGNMGIMIRKNNGKQLLIGTQEAGKAKNAVNKLMGPERSINYGQ